MHWLVLCKILPIKKGRDRSIQGFTFVEVLISLFLLSIILFSFTLIQFAAIRLTHRADSLLIVSRQLTNLSERLTALQTMHGLAAQIQSWNQENKEVLVNSQGRVTGIFPHYKATICYQENLQIGKMHCITENISLG